MMNRLKHGDIKHFITSKQDRIGRDTLDIIATVRAIWELGITPHFTCEGGAFPRTPQNELLMEIKASVAQYERNMIRDRVRVSSEESTAPAGTLPSNASCWAAWRSAWRVTRWPRCCSRGLPKRQSVSLKSYSGQEGFRRP